MNKSEAKEVAKLVSLSRACDAEVLHGIAARTLSALIRAARTTASVAGLRSCAESFGVTHHPDFITC